MMLRARYAMPGADIGCAPTRPAQDCGAAACPRPTTDAQPRRYVLAYERDTRCPVLRQYAGHSTTGDSVLHTTWKLVCIAICLRAGYAMPGTDTAYGGPRDLRYYLSSSENPGELRYVPTRVLRDVRVVVDAVNARGETVLDNVQGYVRCYSPLCYLPTALPGTDVAYGGTDFAYSTGDAEVSSYKLLPIVLRACCAMSGTDVACAARRARHSSCCAGATSQPHPMMTVVLAASPVSLSAYACATRCPPLSCHALATAVPGTLLHLPMPSSDAVSCTDLRYPDMPYRVLTYVMVLPVTGYGSTAALVRSRHLRSDRSICLRNRYGIPGTDLMLPEYSSVSDTAVDSSSRSSYALAMRVRLCCYSVSCTMSGTDFGYAATSGIPSRSSSSQPR
eukprot:203367-Rhodomonas_salina.7